MQAAAAAWAAGNMHASLSMATGARATTCVPSSAVHCSFLADRLGVCRSATTRRVPSCGTSPPSWLAWRSRRLAAAFHVDI